MPTKIQWTDEVWNVVTGCTKVSAGCANCYAERDFHRPYPGRDFEDVQTHPERLELPLRWRKPRKVFTCSMGDLFHEKVPDYFIDAVFAVMGIRNVHTSRLNTFQVLTKRHHRMQDYMETVDPVRLAELAVNMAEEKWGPVLTDFSSRWKEQNGPVIRGDFKKWPLPNIWMGVSVEDQENDWRISVLLDTPAAKRFISFEPLLGPVEVDLLGIDWVIVGGESGPNARPMNPDWVRSIRDQCQEASIPFFFKQWGEYAPCDYFPGLKKPGPVISLDGQPDGMMTRVGKKAAGRMLDGRTWDEFPEEMNRT